MKDLREIDNLPDGALVPIKTFAALVGQGVSTLWRKAQNESDFPRPIRLGARCTRFRMGDVRAYIERRAA
ncbi:helix-turn-helix transcriptional regulator [Melaminivora alkalimesophila]|uniref:AlpA family transcriptional regulator n=1 Tax=Melaminivora alkalimesophila TaxID=1165852 RepID=A0A317RDT9_9BURK|nr:AlpA family phage regulatory protein [Melaminivora alkalimesophila]PWW47733.1 AlpA family transcriptional regulator [Melaminivora alkalimesophila]